MFRDIDYSQSSSSDDYSTASDLTSDLDQNESDYNPNVILNQYVQVMSEKLFNCHLSGHNHDHNHINAPQKI